MGESSAASSAWQLVSNVVCRRAIRSMRSPWTTRPSCPAFTTTSAPQRNAESEMSSPSQMITSGR